MSNNQETEAKFYIDDLKKIKARLQSLGARLIQERLLETNIRFDLPDNSLRSEGRVLRLRQDTHSRMTYKGPGKNEQGILSRTEIEFNVEDFEKAQQFLEALGYQKLLYYEKYRTVYELNDCHIMLDELPFGNFIEVEGVLMQTIRDTVDQLGLQMDKAVSTSYHGLFERLRNKHPKLDYSNLSFASFAGLTITTSDLLILAADG